ncbi:MAG: hypothetical protein K0S36_1970 [Nitrosospira multiformis]|jgi:hypothetical protein|nr:hypothetical protein [Nitrosospira multiformis]
MKYSLLAIVLAAAALSACEYKKHPMDKPPPSAMAERDSAPDFSELDKEEAPGNASGATGDDAKKAPAQ